PPLFLSITRPPPPSTLFPYTTLFRSPQPARAGEDRRIGPLRRRHRQHDRLHVLQALVVGRYRRQRLGIHAGQEAQHLLERPHRLDRKSTRLNSSHVAISYAVFCLKKK